MNLLFNKSVLLLVLCALPCVSAIAQKKKSSPKVFIARVAMIDDTQEKGVLTLVSDSTIVLIPLGKKGTPILDGKDSVVIPTRDVKLIRIKRKASVRRGIFIGLATGAGVGLIVGVMAHEDCEGGLCTGEEVSAAAGAILGAIPGAVLGGIIGSFPRTFRINGQPLTQEQRAKLEKLVLH
jgi:hypothetical protein